MHKDDYLPHSAFDGADWVTASEPNHECVEFTKVGQVIAIRDSDNPDGPILQFTEREIAAMLRGARAGTFDHLT